MADFVEPSLDASMVNTLIQNGVPELAAKHAVFNCGQSADAAIMWFYENIENPVIQTPLLVPAAAAQGSGAAGADGGPEVDPMGVEMLTAMGFTDK